MAKAVLFDFDGVLVDTMQANFEIYNVICEKLGKKNYPTAKEYAENAQGNWNTLFLKLGIRTEEETRKGVEIYREEQKKMHDKVRVFENTDKIFSELKSRGVKIAVVSDNYGDFIKNILEKNGLLDFVDCIVADHPNLKPDPASFLEAMKKLEVLPEETVFVGDMIHDIEAGKNAGVSKVIVTTYGWTPKEILEKYKPDMFVDSPEELLKALNSI